MDASRSSTNTQNTTICDQCKRAFTAPTPVAPLSPETLHSDHVPSDLEISQINAVLEVQEAIVRMYDEEIERLRTILEKLEEERHTVQYRIKERRGAISAVRRIPNEIWDEVFHFCIGDEYSFSAHHGGIWASTLDLSQVCSRWRTIVCAAPDLWTSLHVDLYNIKREIAPVVGLYIDRSGARPLRVCLTDLLNECKNVWYYSDKRGLEDVIGKNGMAAAFLLLKNMERFGDLEIDMDGGMLEFLVDWDKLGYEDGLSFSRLKVLRIAGEDRTFDLDDNDPLVWRSLSEAPELTHIVAQSRIQPELILALPRITSVELTGVVSIDEISNILQHTPYIESLKATFHGRRDTFDPSPISTHSLRQLHLYWTRSPDIEALFPRLELPSLTTLQIESYQRRCDVFSLQPILTMIKQSSCSISNLALELRPLLPDLLKVIQALPKLVNLQFDLPPEQSEISEFLSQLTVTNMTQVIAPELTHLHINAEATLSWNARIADALFRMLDSRAVATGEYTRLTDMRMLFYHAEFKSQDCCEGECQPGVDSAFLERARNRQADGMDCIALYRLYLDQE